MPWQSVIVDYDEDYVQRSDISTALEGLDLQVRELKAPEVGDPYARLAELLDLEYVPGAQGSVYKVASQAVEKLEKVKI